MWECSCVCGSTFLAPTNRLLSGALTSCGCAGPDLHIDMVGRKFGRLEVVRDTKKRQGSHVVWECVCECGAITHATTSALKSGHKNSCGCLKDDVVRRDVTNQVFGDYKALRPTDIRCADSVVWECERSDGTIVQCSLPFLRRQAKKFEKQANNA